MAQCRSDVLITVSPTGDGDLAPAIGATVRVCQLGATGTPCTPLEILYTDPTLGTVQPTNPLTTDSFGNYTFCAKDSTVYLETTYKGTVKIQPTYVIASSGGGGTGGGIQTINTNNNPNQTIAAGTGIDVTSTGGTTTITAISGPLLSSLSLSPSTVLGGNASTGTVTITTPAPTGGATVNLSSNNPSAQVGPSVTVPANQTTGTFVVATASVPATTLAIISGTLGLQQNASLTITAPPPPATPIYGGVGQPGANSTATLNGTNVTLSTGDVIPQLQTTAEQVGQSWSFTTNNQVIYLLLTGGSHTFIDANTGFPFVMNAALTVNLGGRTMYLYQSTNVLVGSYQPRIAS